MPTTGDTTSGTTGDDDRAAKLTEALAQRQREERAELESELERQRRADERVVEALTETDEHPEP